MQIGENNRFGFNSERLKQKLIPIAIGRNVSVGRIGTSTLSYRKVDLIEINPIRFRIKIESKSNPKITLQFVVSRFYRHPTIKNLRNLFVPIYELVKTLIST